MNPIITYFIVTELGALAGGILDLLFADPSVLPHPVVLMGKEISAIEKCFRELLPKSPKGEFIGGALTAVLTVLTTLVITLFISILAFRIHPALAFVVESIWCWQALAMRGLEKEAMNVYENLSGKHTLEDAQKAVGRIVGRDTTVLDETGVTKAACETVAENASDGVIAPLFYMAIGGSVLALTYKAVNTLDSMIGYKNERYLYFGRFGAKMDDVFNYIPSRLTALLWIAAAKVTSQDAKSAFRIWRRDSRNHASPNAAQSESACAGSLNVQLAGPAIYFGELYEKPTIGDDIRPIEREDIKRCCKMLRAGTVIGFLLFSAIRALIYILVL